MKKYARFFYQPCLPLGKDGKAVTSSKEHIDISRQCADEGMVLLKNKDNVLPLKSGEKIALFGKASIEYIKGGGGSGEVYSSYVRNIYEGFLEKEKEGKVFVYLPLIEFYKNYIRENEKYIPTKEQINATWDIVNNMDFCQKRDDMTYDTFASMHVKEAEVPDELIKSAAENSDTAVFTISRFSAEGVDRRPVLGDYYLSDTEKRLIDKLTENFSKVIIVVDSGAQIDLEYVADNDKVQGILFAWQGGMEGGLAIADILCGDVNPSGKLSDTITKSYDCYENKDDFTENFKFVNYHDDIYVGYRYFETIPGKKTCVRYPFGFGLSYTEFELSGIKCFETDDKIIAVVNVKNTGNFAGKEVVELYYSCPQGKLGKPSIELGAFSKTKLLESGESELLTLSFDKYYLSSFDDLGKIEKSAYVLEHGKYKFYVGTSLRDVQKTDFELDISDDIVVQKLTDYCKPRKIDKRLTSDGSYEKLETTDRDYIYGKNELKKVKAPDKAVMFDKVGEDISLDEFVRQFTEDELIDFVGGHAPTGVANTGCFGGLKRLGVPAVPTADGPAGIRLDTDTGVYTTALPCATLLACTWNTELVSKMGAAVGAEMRENNLGVFLAPAMNIHRNPLTGRNFEYYSEDPTVVGKIAAAFVRGVQSEKAAVSVKHFACNNKEADRFESDSRLSERALREIYLKGFEICVREGKPWTVMSSYNLINGQHTSESWELLTGILRNEWGYDGMVETDWGVKNDPVAEVRAGNDLKMPSGYNNDLKKGLEDGVITRADLELCVGRILKMFMKLS